ncbi:MAG: phosphatidate cytidylyltransferase [Alphaproteobacteria bacterium]|nr:phosphatidate cytidylyltransferase [Alphaproteobacteria bacterium]|tara:strand:- start:3177 stop:3821 length:645 start_codon:yes stop_codon:yes gene_type:complete
MGGIQTQKVLKRALSAVVMIPCVLLIIWQGGYLFAAFVGLLAGLALTEMWKMAVQVKHKWLLFAAMAVYMIGGAVFCYHLRDMYGFELTILFFVAMWCSDIGAYFSGKFIGGAKMSPGISPNKTWAGYAGALVFPSLVLSVGMLMVDPFIIAGGFALGIVGQAGDLLISLIKRDAHVKDTGDLIPGHGGVLDRIDSLIPAVIVYLALIKLGIVG